MSSIGEKLRSARNSLNLSLDEVSASTRISLKYLQAMERDDRSIFPGGFFYRSFVLQYARKLGLQDSAVSSELDQLLASEAPLPLPGQQQAGTDLHLRRITPVASRRRGISATGKALASVASFVLVVAGCAGLYAWWTSVRQESQAANPPRAAVARPANPVKTAQAQRPAPAEQAKAFTPSPLDAQAQPAAELTAAMPENARLSLSLAASETTWLSVSADGKPVFSGILQARESKKLGAIERAKLVVGNAGGLFVEWNGKQIGALGRRGQVRVVTFTPDAYTFLDSAERGQGARDSDTSGGADSTR